MIENKYFAVPFVLVCLLTILSSCREQRTEERGFESTESSDSLQVDSSILEAEPVPQEFFIVQEDVYVKDYFNWINKVVDSLNIDRSYEIDEYILVHYNHWIIDTLRGTDYYLLKDRGIISKDPTAHLLVKNGSMLRVPDSSAVKEIKTNLEQTYLDLNIPEYRLRIIQEDSVLYSFLARVGRNDSRYLAMAGRNVDLKTMPGTGSIIRVNRKPTFINPRDNKRYQSTRRDDQVVTALPNIPWLEPEINGIRYGHLIHPTTNIETLGKASSNGCVGLREADAWTLYFYAPLGTEVVFRYDLEVCDESGEWVKLPNIYPGMEHKKVVRNPKPTKVPPSDYSDSELPVCYCGKEE